MTTGLYDTRIPDIGQTSYTVSGLTNDIEYAFIVTAANMNGDSAASEILRSTPTATLPAASALSGTWYVADGPIGWGDRKYVFSGSALDIWWDSLVGSATTTATYDPGSTTSGRVQGAAADGSTWRLLFSLAGQTLTLTYADAAWAPQTLATLALSKTEPLTGVQAGLLTTSSGLVAGSWSMMAWEGLGQAATDRGLGIGSDIQYAVPLADTDTEYTNAIASLVARGATLIVAPGFGFQAAISAAADQYPGLKFLLVDIDAPDGLGNQKTNVATAYFATEQGSYLAGIAAALKTQAEGGDTVGFIGGVALPVIRQFEAGYEAGVASIDPSLKILVDYVGGFTDPTTAEGIAADQYAAGAKVIFHGAGASGDGVIDAAIARSLAVPPDPRWVVGVDIDQYWRGIHSTSPESSVVLASAVKRVDVAVRDLAARWFANENDAVFGSRTVYGLAEGGMDLPGTNAAYTASMATQVATATSGIAAGTLPVATTPTLEFLQAHGNWIVTSKPALWPDYAYFITGARLDIYHGDATTLAGHYTIYTVPDPVSPTQGRIVATAADPWPSGSPKPTDPLYLRYDRTGSTTLTLTFCDSSWNASAYTLTFSGP